MTTAARLRRASICSSGSNQRRWARRRRCTHCDKRFTTYERAEITLPAVVKKGGSRVEFDRAKMRGSMMLALRKRPVSTDQVDAAVDRIKEKLLGTGAREIPSARNFSLLLVAGLFIKKPFLFFVYLEYNLIIIR